MGQPLVSLILLVYKQERFICEAVRSALAQDYTPMEIIVSDDCSPDRTFSLIEQQVATYSGLHRIVLNRNARNVGFVQNLNKACGIARGEYIVVQAGDDISISARVTRLVRAFTSDPAVDYVYSNYELIDEHGAAHTDPALVVPVVSSAMDLVRGGASCGIAGCTGAWSRSVFEKYGPLSPELLGEDGVIPLWGALERGIRYVPEKLVRYRRHDGNLSSTVRCDRRTQEYRAEWRRTTANEWMRALRKSGRTHSGLNRAIQRVQQLRLYEAEAMRCSRTRAFALALRGFVRGLPLRHMASIIRRESLCIGHGCRDLSRRGT